MKKNNKISKIIYTLILLLVVFIISIDNVNADALKHIKGDRIYFSQTGYISKHSLGNQPAYCIQWTYDTVDGAMYYPYSNSAITERKRFIAGKIIEDINSNTSYSDDTKHLYIDRALNTLFGLPGSRDFSGNSIITNYINSATQYVDNTEKLCTGNNTSGCFNSDNFTINYSGNTMNQIGNSNNFISNKITLTGLLSSYGGTGTTYTINVSSPKNTNVAICSNSTGTSCSGNSVTLTNQSSDYSFYIKVTGATPSSTVNITASGSNSASYPYASAYQHQTYYQALMIQSEKSVSRTLSRSATLHIPDVTKYTITATKTDEYGDNLTGASFRVYRADTSGKEIKELAKNSNGSSTLSYTETEYTTSDEWFNYQYCLVETDSPSGYIYGENEQKPLCVTPVKTNSSTCYDTNGKDTGNTEYCETHSKYCSSSNGSFDEETGKCISTSDKLKEEGGLIVKETKDVIITNNYSCSSDYTYNTSTNICERVLSEEAGEENSCTDGFIYNSETQMCEKTETTDPKNEPTTSCPDGYSHEKDEEGNEYCIKYSCDSTDYTYSSDEKICKKISNPDKCKRISDNTEVDFSYCEINTGDYTLVTTGNNSINFVKSNSRNAVSISKTDISGEKELSGAKMKICSTKPDENYDCELAYVTQKGVCAKEEVGVCTNNNDGTMNVYMQWVSDIAPRSWRGLKTNVNYYLVETVAPLGYSVSSYIPFTVSEDGAVKSETTVVQNNEIIVKNNLTKIVISKQDIATSKELSGATLKLCLAAYDEKGKTKTILTEEGDCAVPILADGSEAIWVSTDTPKELVGLPAGTYYLVETITPDDYTAAEKILFTINEDGTITDKDGKKINDNKIIMYDKKIDPPPTGTIIIVVSVLAVAALGFGVFYYLKKVKPKKNI